MFLASGAVYMSRACGGSVVRGEGRALIRVTRLGMRVVGATSNILQRTIQWQGSVVSPDDRKYP